MHESHRSPVGERHESSRPGAPAPHMHLRPEHPEDIPFLLERNRQRVGGALGVSVLAHIAAAVLLIAAITLLPAPTTSSSIIQEIKDYGIVWLPQEGPGGGGGGGGNRMPDPPRKAELPGKDKLTLPVAKPPDVMQPPKKNTPEPPPVEQLSIPAVAMAQ